MYKSFVFIVAMLATAPAHAAEPDAMQAAEQLLELTGMDTALDQSMEAILTMQIQQNPALAQHEPALRTFFRKYMSYESLKPDLAKIYADAFTAGELHEIARFYRTPTGAKTVQLMPTLMQQGGQLGAARVQANIEELHALIAGETAAPATNDKKKPGG